MTEKEALTGQAVPKQPETQATEGVDTWVLKEQVKCLKIQSTAQMLFDKVMLETEHGENLPMREAKMTVYKQPKSRFFSLNIAHAGKRFRLSSHCESKRDAQKIGLLLLAKLMQASFSPTPVQQTMGQNTQPVTVPTFEEASAKYVQEECKGKKLAWRREDLCHRTLTVFFGKYRLDEITPQLITRWMNTEKTRVVREGKKMISPRSVDYDLGYLKRFFNYAVGIQSWLQANPALKIKPLPIPRKENRVLNEEEEVRLLDACGHSWFKRVAVFGLETGLRIGEIAHLKRTDFHLDYGISHFRIQREKNRVVTEFPLASERLCAVIREQMETEHAGEYFFADEQGKALNKDKITGYLKRAVRKAGITKVTANDLRKTFCSRLNWLGCNKMFVEYLMGHTVKGVEQHYLANSLQHVYEELKRIEQKKKNVIPPSYLKVTGTKY